MSRTPRKIRLIKPRLQTKIILNFVCLALVASLAQVIIVSNSLLNIAPEMNEGAAVLRERMPHIMANALTWSLGLLVPFMTGLGVVLTFRVAGPTYRFEQFMKSIARGEDPGVCRIRERDELHELCDAINEAVTVLRENGAWERDSRTRESSESLALSPAEAA